MTHFKDVCNHNDCIYISVLIQNDDSKRYIYIYIYIYIVTVLVVTNSLCRFVANQVRDIYIYIYITALMVRKKNPKNPASDLKMKIYNESLSRGKNIYWKTYIYWKKRKGQPFYTN